MTTWLETDTNTNIDISSGAVIGSYTAPGDKTILAQMFIDQIAGGGATYTLVARVQIGGAGNNYPVEAYISAVASSYVGFQTDPISVRNGDVVSLWIDGDAADTTTPDAIVRWFEIDNDSLVADAVWDELIADHRTAGTYGRRVKLVRPDNLGRRLEEK